MSPTWTLASMCSLNLLFVEFSCTSLFHKSEYLNMEIYTKCRVFYNILICQLSFLTCILKLSKRAIERFIYYCFLIRFPFEGIRLNEFYLLKVIMVWCYRILLSPPMSQPKWAVLPLPDWTMCFMGLRKDFFSQTGNLTVNYF